MCSSTVAIVAPQKQSFPQSSTLGPVSRAPAQPGGLFFCLCRARRPVRYVFQTDTFAARQMDSVGKIWRPIAARNFFKVKWDSTHNQSSGFVVAPVSKASTREIPLRSTSHGPSTGEPRDGRDCPALTARGARFDPSQHHAALTFRAAWPFGRK
jgi:hypothetical protein